MSQLIGNRVPAPVRFDLEAATPPGDIARALLLVTVDDDGSPRIAILSPAEVTMLDDRKLVVEIRDGTKSCANLLAGRAAALWCVLDAAAYTIKGSAGAADDPAEQGWRKFEIAVEEVWRDFDARSPMVAGPTYRVPAAG